jgi:lipopolysaccharide biosynthesis glycosyltransferase
MNLKLVRRLNLLAHAREIAVCNKLEYGDQDAMNIGFWNNWSDFGERWNFQRKSLYLSEIPRKLPSIIHFSDEQKPWRRSDWHPYAWQYLRVLSQANLQVGRTDMGRPPILVFKMAASPPETEACPP